MTRQQAQAAAENILAQMGGDAEQINNGDCATFAKALVGQVGGVVVDGLNESMKSELDGYETQEPQVRMRGASHCWVFVAGYNFDAYNTEGCEYEEDMDWREKI